MPRISLSLPAPAPAPAPAPSPALSPSPALGSPPDQHRPVQLLVLRDHGLLGEPRDRVAPSRRPHALELSAVEQDRRSRPGHGGVVSHAAQDARTLGDDLGDPSRPRA